MVKDAGLCKVEAVAYCLWKEILQIKGIHEVKFDSIIDAGMPCSCHLFFLVKDAGLCKVEAVAYCLRKEILQIKGIHEVKFDNIIDAGMPCSCHLFFLVLREGKWSEQQAAILIPGDIISLKSGDVVPADARLLNGDQLDIDQYGLSGRSFPKIKNPGDSVSFGSICKQGESEAVVFATGVHTYFGKASNLVDNTNQLGHGHLGKVLAAICNFCTCSVMIAIIIKIIVIMCRIQHRNYRDEINNLLVLMIIGIPIAMPSVLSVTMAIGSHRLSEQGAILKRMSAIEELAGMDVLCSDKTGTLTLNKLTVDRNLIEVFAKGVDKEHMILLAARASKTENQDAIDAAIVGMLADPKEARAGIKEVHFLPPNLVDKRTALTYIDSNGDWHRASKGSLEQIVNLCNCKEDVMKKVCAVDDKFARRELRSLAVTRQQVP